MDCIFCKIISGERQCKKVYEDEYTLVTMDKAGDADGHMLVMPKKHVNNIMDTDIETLNQMMATVKKVSNHLVDNCGYEGVDILNANGKAAGQTVPHFHMHIIPRRFDDGLGGAGAWPSFPGTKYELETIHKKVQMVNK